MNENKDYLGTERISSLFLRMVIPSVIAQLISLVYNIVDRIYIGHIPGTGSLALTGIGICMPLVIIISAFASLVGIGGAPLASIHLGRKEPQTAEKILGNCTAVLIGISIVLTIFFQLFASPLLILFGASQNTLPFALEYMRIYVWGTIFVQLSLALNQFITAQGFTKISMMTVLTGAICNIILDPIFIFLLNMGVRGAALATVLSQILSAAFVLLFLTGKKTGIRLKKQWMRPDLSLILRFLSLGLSPFVMQSTECILSICFNNSLLKYGGDIAVGAMSVFATVMQLATLPLTGIAQGAQPITSYNYGAGNWKRVASSFKLLLAVSLAYSTLMWITILLAPRLFIRIFTSDPELIAYSSSVIRIYFGALLCMGAQLACQNTFLALGNAKVSLFLALLRKVFLLIPLIYILPVVLPFDQTAAVLLAEPIADALAALTTLTMFLRQYRKYLFAKKST